MLARNTATEWGWVAKALHWSMAGLIFFMLGLGVYMVWIVTDPIKAFPLFQMHKSFGFVVFCLAVLRAAWRLSDRTRPGPVGPKWQHAAATVTHAMLYLLIFALPLSGWVMVSAAPLQDLLGMRNMVFGLFALPDPFVPGVQGIEDAARWVHATAAILLAGLLALHVGAALRHALVDRDDVLARMSWGR